MNEKPDFTQPTGAIFSPCRKYRYVLWRRWDTEKPLVMFIGLNPSKATAERSDNTVTRCIQFSKNWGFGGILMANLFGYRATDPKDMYAQEKPVGYDNDFWLLKMADASEKVICAWGNHGAYRERADAVVKLLSGRGEMLCLGTTKDGYPRHPSRLGYETKLEVYKFNVEQGKEI